MRKKLDIACQALSRRNLLKGGALAGAALATGCSRLPTIVPRHVLGGKPRFVPPSEKLRIAAIGCGGKGKSDIESMAHEAIVALCDVDDARAAETYEQYPNLPRYRDFRVMLEKMENQIDAVIISTPDHTHAPAAILAMQMGKHVFVQKPLSHSIEEARLMRHIARRTGVVTQMGIQGHASDHARNIHEWVNAGLIGPVREVHIWTNRPIWAQNLKRPAKTDPVPKTLDWDLWLGPAPGRPYVDKHPATDEDCYAPFHWRGWWDFGCGALGDIGCHTMDASFWALEIGRAQEVEVTCESGPFNKESFPEWSRIRYRIPARGQRPELTIHWYDGGKRPPRPEELDERQEMPENGQLFVGDNAKLMAGMYGESPRLLPDSAMDALRENRPPKSLWRSPGIHEEFITACKGGPTPGANFEYSTPLTELVHLGNIAMRAGEPIRYNFEKGRVMSNRQANAYLGRPYRKGWDFS